MKSHWNHSKDLKVKHMMYILKKSIRLRYTVMMIMMIRDYKQLVELHHIQMVQVLEKYKKWSY